MSSEVCPFCGKTYKRLKSHLPHCKAAASSKTPPTKHDVTVNQTASSTQLDSTAESTDMLTSLQSNKSKKKSAASQSLSPSSASPPSTAKKNKKKLSEQIKTASIPTATSKPKKQSLRALIEAARSEPVSTGSLEGTGTASEERLSSSTPLVADPLTSRTTAETKTNPDKDSVQDNAHAAFPSADSKPKAATRKKTKKSIPTAKDTSNSLHSEVNKSGASSRVKDNFWVDSEGEVEDLKMKSLSGLQTRITLQDVKATLGRAKDGRQSKRPSILSQIQADQKISPVPLPADSSLVTKTQQPTALQPVSRNSLKSALIPLQQLEISSPAAPLLSPSQVGKAVSVNEALKETKLLTISPSLIKFSRAEPLRADGGLKSQLEIRKENTADNKAAGAVTQRSLGQVKLRELPEWLACRTPSHPKQVVEMVQSGWQWYYKRYIDVRRGGVGGLGMLLAGYCVLSYIWSYPHIKRDRWRKYH
ncbi:uncharacterized protein si:dkey-21c1.4 [Centropristis striata]|uniref:uncharacterized protein si:dkey-21c1.4 n=1 Tax=Centropristis striata TaxID=184440 RepID=UPI0027E1D5DB|nr:uncharacterized protein si:dkey-21c1.4 [Centropristis striata]XP_059180490.1 uncharacterized protein si:dkey-21c1.4 [Centropristis striata]XP_059180491.1 uncharacterized protein si:dkey-21c1.4 [Centropristis striata]XP_059180492.1 uncharacterized protein si:dkey-21c1.4 [Centropristis striata]